MDRRAGRLHVVSSLLRGATALIAAALLLPATAVAATPPALTVSPAAPRVGQPITLKLRAHAALPAGMHLRFGLTLLGTARAGCAASASAAVRRRLVRAGRTVSVTLKPGSRGAWCPGPWKATARVVTAGSTATRAYSRALTILLADGTQAGTPVRITLLGGSTETVSAAGRPDRAAALSGVLRGEIPGMFRPSSDIRTSITTGALVATGLPADPLCTPAGAAEPRAFDVADGAGSSATLRASGHTDMTLVVRADLFAFTGCLPAVLTPTTGATSLVLSGDVGPGGLNALTLNGSAGPLALAGVGDATVAFHLVTQIDLSGRG